MRRIEQSLNDWQMESAKERTSRSLGWQILQTWNDLGLIVLRQEQPWLPLLVCRDTFPFPSSVATPFLPLSVASSVRCFLESDVTSPNENPSTLDAVRDA